MSLTVAQPFFVPTNVAGSNVIPTSIEAYSVNDIVSTQVSKEVFSRPEYRELLKYCPDAGKVTDEVSAKLEQEGFSYEKICTQLNSVLSETDNAKGYCEVLKQQNLTCNNAASLEQALFNICKKRKESEKTYSAAEDYALLKCKAMFSQNKWDIERFCRQPVPLTRAVCSEAEIIVSSEWKAQCVRNGGELVIKRDEFSGCGYPICDYKQGPKPILVRENECPYIPSGWENDCTRAGGKPRPEMRGNCLVQQCSFSSDSILGNAVCPAIWIPPNWQEQCRQRGGIPIPDDSYGCPKAECRMPNQACPTVPSENSEFAMNCRQNGGFVEYNVDQVGCKYAFCNKGQMRAGPVMPCPELPGNWKEECSAKGGNPSVESDPMRPACMKFECRGMGANAICPTAVENNQRVADCNMKGGGIYYAYGQGGCQIAQCNMPTQTNQICQVDPFTPTMEVNCKASGGSISMNYYNGCSYKFCMSQGNNVSYSTASCPAQGFLDEMQCRNSGGTISSNSYTLPSGVVCSNKYCFFPPTRTCPPAPFCSNGEVAIATATPSAGSCPVYQCQSTSCQMPPSCPGGTIQKGGTYNGCTTYTCASTIMPSGGETCPQMNCATDQASESGGSYMYTTPSGNQITCARTNCVSTASYPACPVSSCSGGAQSCTTGQTLKSGSNLMFDSTSGQKCACRSSWCEGTTTQTGTNTCNCGPAPTPTCPSGQTVVWTNQPLACSTPGFTCARASCQTLTACPTSVCPTPAVCSSGMVQKQGPPSSMNNNGQQCSCTSTWCEQDTSGLTECSASMCPTPVCNGGTIKTSDSAYTTTENGRSCKCYSKWCDYSGSTSSGTGTSCGNLQCPTPPPMENCGSGCTSRSDPYTYTPPGCTTGISCQSSSCDCSGSGGTSTLPPCTESYCTPISPPSCSGTLNPVRSTMNPSGCTGSISCISSYDCTPATPPVNQSVKSKATGLVVESEVPNVLQSQVTEAATLVPVATSATSESICTRSGSVNYEGFVKSCLENWRTQVINAYLPESIESSCVAESKANVVALSTVLNLDVACSDSSSTVSLSESIAAQCKARAVESSDKFNNAYAQCKQSISRDKIRELIKHQVEMECTAISMQNSSVIGLFSNLTTSSSIEQTSLELLKGDIVLTRAQYEELKQQLRKDIFADLQAQFAQMFGARAEEARREAQLKREQCTKQLELVKTLRSDVCSKYSDVSCEEKVASMEREAKQLCNEADAQYNTAGGLIETVKALVNALSSKPTG
ncbi:MAG: hypothetical protein V1931_00085 [Candidatus Micrarchaeota archaeon]